MPYPTVNLPVHALIVDDDSGMRAALASYLTDNELRVSTLPGGPGLDDALQRDIVDLTGAGDALMAAVIFGLLNDIPISEAVRLGVSAAAMTIQCPETVCPDLSLDRLYGELVV